MDTFKYETHIHTRQGSACGAATGAELADYYKELGYSGFIVTDHFLGGNTAVRSGLPWEKAIAQFCTGYEDAKRRGDEIDFDVFFGLEYCFHGTEFLIYGTDKDCLIRTPQIREPDLRKALYTFKSAGAFIVHAHPFREAPYIDMFRLLPELTDAVEVYNAHNTIMQNERARLYAEEYGLLKIAGGDFHRSGDDASGVELQKRPGSYPELLEMLAKEEFSLIKT
jgi:hypothetical protein